MDRIKIIFSLILVLIVQKTFSQWTLVPNSAFNNDSVFIGSFIGKDHNNWLFLSTLKYESSNSLVNSIALYSSNNGGNYFNRLFIEENIVSRSGISGKNDTVFVSFGNNKFIRTFNFGQSWDTLDKLNGIPYFLGYGRVLRLDSKNLYLSDDYGKNWVLHNTILDYDLFNIAFKSSGFAAYMNPVSKSVFTSLDFGKTFIEQSEIIGLKVNSYTLEIVNERIGYLMNKDEILKTSDGYKTWKLIKKLPGNTNSSSESIQFINEKDGFYTFRGELYKTNDSGKTWCIQPINVFGSYALDRLTGAFRMSFVDDSIGFYTAAGGPRNIEVFKTTNQGGPPCPSDTTIKGLGAEPGFNQLKVFPNPSAGLLTLSLEQGQMSQVQLFSMEGRLVFTQKLSEQEVTLQLPAMSPGIYMLEVQSTANKVFRQKLVIE